LHAHVPINVPIPGHFGPVHAHTSHFLTIHLNIMLPSTAGSSKWSRSLSFPHQNPLYAYPIPKRAICCAHLFLLGLITRTILGEEYRLFRPRSFLHSPVTSSLLGPNSIQPIACRILFYSTISRNFKIGIVTIYSTWQCRCTSLC
jgi:hypothetical protein